MSWRREEETGGWGAGGEGQDPQGCSHYKPKWPEGLGKLTHQI